MSEAAQKKFKNLVRELGRLIRTQADECLSVQKSKAKAKSRANASPWASAFVEARWFADAEGYTAKLRIVLPNGSLQSLRTTNDVDELLDKMSRVRKENSSAKWYGLKVIVSPEGAVTTEFNNDRNCVVDPTWFHS